MNFAGFFGAAISAISQIAANIPELVYVPAAFVAVGVVSFFRRLISP